MSKEGKNLAKARHYLEANRYRDGAAPMLLDRLRCDIPNSRLAECKFMLGVARLYIENQLMIPNDIFALNKVLKYIAVEPHLSEYDNNLNGEKLSVLLERFNGIIKEDLKQSISNSKKRILIPNMDYDIIPIDSQKEASKYRKYTSWCVTNGSYDTYTSDGSGRFYFCLKKGFKDIEEKEGEGCPLDEYGLSMIAVSICMDGSVNTITCRWNHNNKGNDHILSVEQLEDIIGRNFYSTFKPYTKEELHAKRFIFFDEVQDILDSGADPCRIFKEVFRADENHDLVKLNNKYNLIDAHHKLLFERWFDIVVIDFLKTDGVFFDGFAGVKLDGKWNFINTKGEYLSQQWFDEVGDFKDGFAWVVLNGKWNFINAKGELLSEQWFDWAGNFYDGFAVIQLSGKSNFINTEGKLISSQWFDYACCFLYGFAVVKLNEKYYTIDTNGKLDN